MPHEQNSDEQSLARQAVDNADAFQELYHLYFTRVYRYVAARIDNPHDTEDAVSEVFLRVIRNLDQLRNQQVTSFAAWLFTIARHTVADHYRRNLRGHVPLTLDTADAETLVAPEAEPDSLITGLETSAELYHLVTRLPERMRETVLLRYYGGLRNVEIAMVLGIGEKTVSATLSRALDNLQTQYAAKEG